MKCSSLAALEVVKMTTSSAASDVNFVKMTTFLFQCMCALANCKTENIVSFFQLNLTSEIWKTRITWRNVSEVMYDKETVFSQPGNSDLFEGCVYLCYRLYPYYVGTQYIPWWRHQMKTFSALLALCEGNPPVTGGFPYKSQRRGALIFSLICAWTNGWVNN